MLDLIAGTGLFQAGECVKVEHDPATDQLKVLERLSFEQARQSAGPAHYEVLLCA
jgi:hypothetical protein